MESVIIDSSEYLSYNTPVFSPDSKQLLFAVLDGSAYKLAISNIDGTGRTKITDTASVAISPSENYPHPYGWSPDGTKIIYFAGAYNSSVTSLTIVDVQSKEKTIIATDTIGNRYINWSSSGRYLLFQKISYTQDLHSAPQTIGKLFLYDTQVKTLKQFDVPYQLPTGTCAEYQLTPDEKNIILNTSEWANNYTQSLSESFSLDISSGKFISTNLPPYQFYIGQELTP
jgi:hypothetical protein